MPDPYSREKIETWVADFCESSRYATLSHAVKEYAARVLVTLLDRALDAEGGDLSVLSEKALRRGLLEGVATLQLPESVKPEVPLLCRSFLEELGDQGRLASGADLGRYVGALRSAYREAAAVKPRPLVSPASKIGRNDSCPCGSGKKYKRCCMGLLDGP